MKVFHEVSFCNFIEDHLVKKNDLESDVHSDLHRLLSLYFSQAHVIHSCCIFITKPFVSPRHHVVCPTKQSATSNRPSGGMLFLPALFDLTLRSAQDSDEAAFLWLSLPSGG